MVDTENEQKNPYIIWRTKNTKTNKRKQEPDAQRSKAELAGKVQKQRQRTRSVTDVIDKSLHVGEQLASDTLDLLVVMTERRQQTDAVGLKVARLAVHSHVGVLSSRQQARATNTVGAPVDTGPDRVRVLVGFRFRGLAFVRGLALVRFGAGMRVLPAVVAKLMLVDVGDALAVLKCAHHTELCRPFQDAPRVGHLRLVRCADSDGSRSSAGHRCVHRRPLCVLICASIKHQQQIHSTNKSQMVYLVCASWTLPRAVLPVTGSFRQNQATNGDQQYQSEPREHGPRRRPKTDGTGHRVAVLWLS
jgi:hypothetical protein